MRKKIEEIIEQSFDVVRIGNKVYYTSKSKSDEKFKRRIEELLTLHGVSNRRELLLDFADLVMINDCDLHTKKERALAVEKYLKGKL